MFDLYQVERILFAPFADRGGGACLYDKGRASAFEFIPVCGMADVADVKMAGQEYIRSALGYLEHCLLGTADNIVLILTFGNVERMMCYDTLTVPGQARPSASPSAICRRLSARLL